MIQLRYTINDMEACKVYWSIWLNKSNEKSAWLPIFWLNTEHRRKFFSAQTQTGYWNLHINFWQNSLYLSLQVTQGQLKFMFKVIPNWLKILIKLNDRFRLVGTCKAFIYIFIYITLTTRSALHLLLIDRIGLTRRKSNPFRLFFKNRYSRVDC